MFSNLKLHALHTLASLGRTLNARYYNPSTGRFLTQDSYTGNPYDPWTQNLYAYCGNNPVNFVDPTGHFFGALFSVFSADSLGGVIGAIVSTVVTVALVATITVATGGAGGILMGAIIGAASAAAGDTVGQVAECLVDGKPINIDKDRVERAWFYGAIGGGFGSGLAQLGGYGVGTAAYINALTVDVATGFCSAVHNEVEKNKVKITEQKATTATYYYPGMPTQIASSVSHYTPGMTTQKAPTATHYYPGMPTQVASSASHYTPGMTT